MAIKGQTISEYLVGLGFDVNVDGLKQFYKAIEEGARKISISQKLTQGPIAQTITTFVGLGAQAAKTVLDMTSSVANFDKQMELAARKAWMSKDSYMALSESVSALGYSLDDLGEIALDPELSSQFRELYMMSQSFQTQYSGVNESLKTMREFQFQFQKMRLVASYFMKMLGANLVRYFSDPLDDANITLSDIIDKVARDMPYYVDMVTQKAGPVIKKGFDWFSKILGVAKNLYEYFEKNPEMLKLAAGIIFTIYGLFNKTHAIVAILFVLLSDYLSGTNSDSERLEGTWNSISELFSSIVDFSKALFDWTVKWIKKLDESGTLKWFADLVSDLTQLLRGDFSLKNKNTAVGKGATLVSKGADTIFGGLSDLLNEIQYSFGWKEYTGSGTRMSNDNRTTNMNANIVINGDNKTSKQIADETVEELNAQMERRAW